MSEKSRQEIWIKDLLERLREGKALVLLAGAGISATAGVRTGQQLSKELRERHPALFRPEENLSYSDVFRRTVPEVRLRRALIEEECFGRSSQAEHLWIAQLMKEQRVRAVITTNFDHLIEHALIRVGARGIPVVLNDDELRIDSNAREGTPLLIKIHGDFLFDHIANLPEELAAKLRQNMSHALLDLTTEADLLVIGYSGSDDTVVQLIGEIVRNRSPSVTRVWWSEYWNEEPAPQSALAQLLRSAVRAGNPITRFGPWTATDCLASLGAGVGSESPKPRPFGIGFDGLTMPADFASPLQELPGDSAQRSACLATERRLDDWVNQGGVILLVHDPGTGGSTLLAAVADKAANRGLYYDTRFGERPVFLDLRTHLIALASHLGTDDVPTKMFSRDAVIVIDGLATRTLSSGAHIEQSFLSVVQALAEGQRTAKCGALVLGTHLDPAQLRKVLPWLPGEEMTYRIHQPVLRGPTALPPQGLEPLLDVLGLASTAIPSDCAVRAAFGTIVSIDWRQTAPYVDRRGQRMILHERELRRRRPKLVALEENARNLARELVLTAEGLPPLRRLGLALEAESLYFGPANRQREAMSIFLGCAEAGMRHPFTRRYFIGTLLEYVSALLSEPSRWFGLCLSDAMSFINIVSRLSLDPTSFDTLLRTMSVGRSDLEKRILLASIPPEALSITPAMDLAIYRYDTRGIAQSSFRYWLRILIPGYRKARRARKQPQARALAALQIGAAWYALGDMTSSVTYHHRGRRWSQRARRDAFRSKNSTAGRLAADNEIVGLLNTNSLSEAEELLRQRRKALAHDQGFSAEKAVTFSSYFQLKLRQGDRLAAEAHFFEAVLQCVALQRWHGLAANLFLLARFASIDSRLPSPNLVEVALKDLVETYDTNPI